MIKSNVKNSRESGISCDRRSFLKFASATGVMAAAGFSILPRNALGDAYEPYFTDDQLETVVTSCAHNCGSRHMLVAHKKGDVIVRLSTDNGTYQGDEYGTDTPEKPQLRACLRGRAYRCRLYSPERLLYPMIRVGRRGEGRFRRASWDEALDLIAQKMIYLKQTYGPTAILDQSYAGASWGVLHKSDQIEGLLGRFLGNFGCRTNSWSVPSYQGTTFSSLTTFGTIEDGNEDDTFAHAKLMIMWGWNPAYTFHGGNTHYYMRLAKQRGCKFVVVDPQYTDSAATYDAWWIPIKPNTDAAMLAAMAHYIFTNGLHDQKFIDQFCLGMDQGTMPPVVVNDLGIPIPGTRFENFKDYIFGRYDGQPKTPQWAEPITGVKAADIEKLARMYALTKPAALKASWAPGRNAYGEQYSRMVAALQAMTGNIGVLGGSAEGVGKAWHAEAGVPSLSTARNEWFASIKSDRWAHCVLNYPNVRREDVGLFPHPNPMFRGVIPNIKAIFWQGSNWLNQLPHINKQLQAMEKLEFVVCMDSTITPSGVWSDVLLPIATHFERHDVALPWYKGHYYIHRPKVIEPLGESKTDMQVFTELSFRLGGPMLAQRFNPRADRSYFQDPSAVDEAYLQEWWHAVQEHQQVMTSWERFKQMGVFKFTPDEPHIAFQEQIEQGKPFATPSGKIEIFSMKLSSITDWTQTQFGFPIPYIPKWIEPWESLNSEKAEKYPFHLVSPHPRWRTHSIFNNIPWLRETYQQEVTIAASDAKRLGIKNGDTVQIWNDRGGVVAPAYVTERCLPGVAVLHEGPWMDPDKEMWDRAGNPDFLTLDEPSPAGAFAYNTVLCNIRKSDRPHRDGWDQTATARSHIYRRGSSK